MNEVFDNGKSKSRGWLTLVYPDSAPADWLSRLESLAVPALVSPLHAADVNADGGEKKPHYHVVLLWDGPTTRANAQKYADYINGGVLVVPMASLRGAGRYLCHLDNPEKAQYDPADVRVFGGLDYQEIINSSSDDLLTLFDIFDYIDAYCVVSFRQLIYYCRTQRTEWARVILTKHRENVIAYQKSLKWELDQAKAE